MFLIIVLVSIPRPSLYETKPVSQAVYDRHGSLLRLTLSNDEKYRLRVKLRDIAPVMHKATLLYEDRYFYQHYGINPVALIKAFWTTYVSGDARVGASTITMQTARLRFNIHSQSITGKIYQILRALQIEWHYSKDEILEAYLNLAPYGGNIEGIEAASLIYFNKTADRLSLHEALTLAVIPQSPAYRSLDKSHDNPGLVRARDELISRWLDEYPQSSQQAELLKLPLHAANRKQLPFSAPHFVEAYLKLSDQQNNYTSLDLELQDLLSRTLSQYIETNKSIGMNNATALLIDYRDMGIRAMVGSVDYFNEDIHGQVNGVLARRSPGSTLKPFIYSLALQQGLVHTRSILKDAPASFGAYNPENYDQEFIGPVTVADALVKSRNIPAVIMAEKLASPDLYDFLKLADVYLPEAKQHYGLSLVLGGSEVSMYELVRLYAALANKGIMKPIQWNNNKKPLMTKRILTEEASYLGLHMLAGNQRPGRSYQNVSLRNQLPVYWKTGTSYGYRDAWSIGVFGPYVLAVWVGNFQGDGNHVLIGRKAAAPLFFRIIDAIKARQPAIAEVKVFQPDSVKLVKVCAHSGEIAHDYCTVKVNSGFIPGVSPINQCGIHRNILIDKATGLRACHESEQTVNKVYEFWPSDLLSVFKQAGMERKIPPPFLPACKQYSYTVAGIKPEITSPLEKVKYIYQINRKDKYNTIAFNATSDADVRYLYWFINETYLGKTKAGVPYYWQSKPGQYVLRVVDDHGRSGYSSLDVSVAN
ncbi:MAG: penicillin-binding protein 1C [Gammaproteobacteria bacterium]|nr:penicillin-binding protein 1C [Gammaproteobacteria bacterium]